MFSFEKEKKLFIYSFLYLNKIFFFKFVILLGWGWAERWKDVKLNFKLCNVQSQVTFVVYRLTKAWAYYICLMFSYFSFVLWNNCVDHVWKLWSGISQNSLRNGYWYILLLSNVVFFFILYFFFVSALICFIIHHLILFLVVED